MMQNKLID